MAFRTLLRCRLGSAAALATGAAALPTCSRDHQLPDDQRRSSRRRDRLFNIGAPTQPGLLQCETERELLRKGTRPLTKESSHMKEISSKVNVKSILQKSKTFENLDDAALDAVCAVAQPLWLKKGGVIIEEGKENSTMFIVCHGTLAASVNDEQVATLDAGSLVGEYSAVRVSNAKATVKVTSSICYVAAVSKDALQEALDEDSWALLEWLVDEKAKEYMASNFLRTVPIFAEASEEFYKDAAKQLTYKAFPNGATLFTAGESDDKGMFILRSGEIEAHITKDIVKTLGPLTVIGEIMLVSPNAVRTATVKAKTDIELLQMRRSDFMQLLTKYPKDMLPLRKVARMALKKTSSSVRLVAD